MDDNLCQLCRQINLHSLGAFYHETHWVVPAPKTASNKDGDNKRNNNPAEDSDSDDEDIAKEVDPYCVTRTRAELSDDCPLCQLFLDPEGPLSESLGTPEDVLQVTIKAKPFSQPESSHFLPNLWSVLYESSRLWLSRLGRIEYFPVSQLQLETIYKGHENIPALAALDVFLDREHRAEERRYVAGRSVLAAESDESLAKVASWLNECTGGHSVCNIGVSGRRFDDGGSEERSAGGAILPDRVIRVGGGFEPYLVENMDQKKRGRYAALSYCWGPFDPDNPPFRLLRGNRASMLERLPLAELPPTIADAIDFTRRLGIDYIWIDRLCIVQDDKSDWQAQAVKMCDVYEGATLTVATVAAGSGDEGLYLPRSPRPSVRVRCATRDRQIGHMHVARRFDPGPVAAPHDPGLRDGLTPAFMQELGLGKWNRRGWTMQERLISRRVVYFGRSQLFWECQEATRKEDCVEDGSHELGARSGGSKRALASSLSHYPLSARASRALSALKRSGDDGSSSLQRASFWVDIIKSFTTRELSFHGDKEKALAGVAKAVGLRLGFSLYAYGIFLELAERLLMWYSDAPLTKPQDFEAPSWTWMSYDGPMKVITDSFSSRLGACSFLDSATLRSMGTSTMPSCSDPVALKISGARVPVTWQRTEKVEPWLMAVYEALNGMLSDSMLDDVTDHVAPSRMFADSMMDSKNRAALLVEGRICGAVQFDMPKEQRQASLACLIVGETTDSRPNRRKKDASTPFVVKTYYLVVLEAVSPDTTGTPVYRRVGIAQAVWAGDLGCPIHEKALSGDIVII